MSTTIKQVFKERFCKLNNEFLAFGKRIKECCEQKYFPSNYQKKYGCIHTPLDFDELFKLFKSNNILITYKLENEFIIHKELMKPQDLTFESLYKAIYLKSYFKQQILLLAGLKGMRINHNEMEYMFIKICDLFLDSPYTTGDLIIKVFVVDADKYIKNMPMLNIKSFKSIISKEISYYKKENDRNNIYL